VHPTKEKTFFSNFDLRGFAVKPLIYDERGDNGLPIIINILAIGCSAHNEYFQWVLGHPSTHVLGAYGWYPFTQKKKKKGKLFLTAILRQIYLHKHFILTIWFNSF
jgi:hypothetical protein